MVSGLKIAASYSRETLLSRATGSSVDTQTSFKEDMKAKLAEAGDKLVIVDFFATWCGPCKMIAPQVEELSKTSPNVVFLKVDVDENEDLAAEYEIASMPTFVFIKNGEKLDSFSGASLDRLKDMIAKHQ